MGKKFISILGTNKYTSVKYSFGDFDFKTAYIQEFLIRYFCKDWGKEDKAIIFLTDLARKNNWENSDAEDKKLKEILYDLKNEGFNLEIVDIDIPDGKNNEEIWGIFETIFNSIDEKDEVLFDVTHGFRSLPMLALTVLNYAKVIKNINIIGIHYGAYENRKIVNGEELAPVFDLTEFDNVLEWSFAVNAFLKYGNAHHLLDVAKENLVEKLKARDDEAIKVRDFIESLREFTDSILTCRGKYLDEYDIGRKKGKSVKASYKDMKFKLSLIKEDKSLKTLSPLFEKIEERTKYFNVDNNFMTGIAIVRWSIENNLIQQAYTGLDETVITYLCNKFGLDETNSDHREEIITKAINIKAQKISRDKWWVKDEYIDQVENVVEKIDKNLADLYQKIKNSRNDLNHLGFTQSVKKNDDFKREINELFEGFLKIVDMEV